MPLPFIPLAAVAVGSVSAYLFAWYHNLSREEQREADQEANEIAFNLFGSPLDRLNSQQVRRVHDQVKSRFG